MRKLLLGINLSILKQNKKELVPTLFTEHQFQLIEKKLKNQELKPSEKVEFSRSVAKKIKVINKINGKQDFFVYGEEKIRKDRLNLAKKYLKLLSRKFKNKPIIISGSFLYSKDYNDIDIFIIEKYEKEDFCENRFHFNYLTEKVYNSLFFASLQKLCLSNQKLGYYKIKEKVNLNLFISLYQELFNDLDRNFIGVKKTLREFLLQSCYLKKSSLSDSQELDFQIKSILKIKKRKEIIKKIFIETIILGFEIRESQPAMKEMIKSYQEVKEEYPQHQEYYQDLISTFEEVLELAS